MKIYDAQHVGCYADGALGHVHVRRRLADLLGGMDAVGRYMGICAALREPMSDDASEEIEALEALNGFCHEAVRFAFVDGDLVLLETEEE